MSGEFFEGVSINFREANASDAEFILGLRLDKDLNRYIYKVDDDIEKQKNYIKNCHEDPTQVYFIIENKDKKPLGTIRIHDFTEETFTLGSLVVRKDTSRHVPIESIFLSLAYGFKKGFNKVLFCVKKANKGVASVYKKLGAVLISEDDHSFYYEYTPALYNQTNPKYHRLMKYPKL